MSSLFQVSNESGPFIIIGPVTVHKQMPPKQAKNGIGSVVILKSEGSEMMLYLKDSAAKWKLPLAELSLRGKFVKEEWGDKKVLTCEELTPPEGSTEFPVNEIVIAAGKVTIKDCLEAGLLAARYIEPKNTSCCIAAFEFAAKAHSEGMKFE